MISGDGRWNKSGAVFRRGALTGLILLILLWTAVCGLSVCAAYDPPKAVPALTGRRIYDFLNVAESQKGYRESVPVGDQKSESYFGAWTGAENSTRAWCSEFLAWCAHQADIPTDVIPTARSAKQFRSFYAERNAFFLVEGGVADIGCGCSQYAASAITLSQIRPGDILIIETAGNKDPTSMDHTAVCRGIERTAAGVKILTIEGNVNKTYTIDGNKVKLGTVVLTSRTAAQIHGVCRPIYGNYCEEYGQHTWDQGASVRAASCTVPELIRYTCSICGNTREEEGAVLPHRETVDAAIAPSCEIAGATAGTHCADCKAVVQVQQPVAASGHAWDAGTVQVEAKPLADGWMRYTCTVCSQIKSECIPATGAPAAGTRIRDTATEAIYLVTKAGLKNGTVSYAGPTDQRLTSVTIRSRVMLDGISYRVTAIADHAFAANRYIEEISAPSSVKKIGKRAFYKCSRLKSITLKSGSLKKTRIGKQAFKGIHKKAVFHVPSKKVNTYKKLFQLKGAGKNSRYQAY